MTTYIYESPDRGKTVYRREFSKYKKKELIMQMMSLYDYLGHAAELDHTHQGMNAMMSDFNNYQVETDRKIAELEKQLEIKMANSNRQINKLKKELPTEIRKVISHIEFAKPLDNK